MKNCGKTALNPVKKYLFIHNSSCLLFFTWFKRCNNSQCHLVTLNSGRPITMHTTMDVPSTCLKCEDITEK